MALITVLLPVEDVKKKPSSFDPAIALQHLGATHPRFAELIAQARPFAPHQRRPLVRPFHALAESIAYQQLSGKAAATIFARVMALYPGRNWLEPAEVVATPDEQLRAAGLSRSKTAALKDLAAKTLDGTVPSAGQLRRMSDEEIIQRLTSVRGIGRWTVEMLLLFDLGRLDVWPVLDYGVQKGYAKTFGKRKLPKPKEFQRIGEKWRPYRSVAAWYFWRALDVPSASSVVRSVKKLATKKTASGKTGAKKRTRLAKETQSAKRARSPVKAAPVKKSLSS